MPRQVSRSVFLWTCMLITGMSAFGQSRELDSLKSLLKDASGNRKAHLLNEIGFRVSREEALTYYELAIAEATDSIILARSVCNKAIILKGKSRLKEAEKMLEKSIPEFEKILAANHYTVTMYSILGRIHMFSGRYSSAMELFQKNLAMSQKGKDSLDVTGALIELGLLHYKIRRNDKALEFYRKARDFLLDDKQVAFYFYMNSSLCLSEMGHPSQGLEYCKRANPYTEDKEIRLLHLDFATGFAELKRGHTAEARGRFLRSLRRSIQQHDVRMQTENLLYIAKACIADAMLDSASSVLDRAEKLAITNSFKEILLDIYRGVIEIAGRRNQFFELAAYQQKYIQLKREVYNIDLEKNLASFQSDWYENENKQMINLQRSEINERNRALDYQQWITAGLNLVILLVLVIIVLFLRGFYLQRQSQLFLEDKVHSRFNRLNLDGYSPIQDNSDRHTQKAREFNQRIGMSCREMAELLDKCAKEPGDDSVVTHFEEVASAYLKTPLIYK